MSDKIIIIGASHAGIACAEQLRKNGFAGQITIIDRLNGLPFERPPLSKAFLQADGSDDAKFLLRRSDWFTAYQIDLVDGRIATAIDPVQKQISLDDGCRYHYDRLVLATGAVPRQLAAASGLDGVFVLRHPDDAHRLRMAIEGLRHAVVIGGGYIGLEVAASLTKIGVKVDVIEMADRLLARVASPPISDFFAELHQSHDVRLHLGASSDEILQQDGSFAGIRLDSGMVLDAELLLVGIGVAPDLELAADAGLACGNGILVNARMQTSLDDIFAIGDVALIDGAALRIESVDNAKVTAARAAAAICGTAQPALAAPWFWSEQFDVRLQSAGIVPLATAEVQYSMRPGKREGGFSVWSYDQAGALAAVEAVHDSAGYMLGKKCLDEGLSPDPDKIVNADFDLKAFIAEAAQ